jgi:hypothetical protein
MKVTGVRQRSATLLSKLLSERLKLRLFLYGLEALAHLEVKLGRERSHSMLRATVVRTVLDHFLWRVTACDELAIDTDVAALNDIQLGHGFSPQRGISRALYS